MTSGNAVGSKLAAETLAAATDRVYGLCGGHIQPIWDALIDTDATIIATRDERAAVHAAQAEAETGGGLGVALVTAGPGLTNALTGVANAATTGVPLLVVAGRPPTPQLGRGALQEIPQQPMTEPVATAATTVHQPDRIPGQLREAAEAALHDRAPAYVEIPTDVIREQADTDPVIERPAPRHESDPTDTCIDRAVDALQSADRPIVVAGRGSRSEEAAGAVRAFIEDTGMPYLPTAGSKGVVPADHTLCVPGARSDAYDTADLLLLLGKRRDFTLAYGSDAVFDGTTFVQIDIDGAALRQNGGPDVAICGPVAAVTQRLTARLTGEIADEEWVADLQETHERRVERLDEQKQQDGRPIHPYRVCGAVERSLGDPAVIVCDGGDALSFGRVALRSTGPRGYLDPGPMGCLGVGVPFAIGAKLARPDADVVCFTGDGSLGFNLAELETAARLDLDLTVVVANNAAWNIERYDQLENYGRAVGSTLSGARYDEVAEAMGVHGRTVTDSVNLDDVVAEAFAIDGPALVDVAVDPDAVSPDAANGLARVPNYQALETWDYQERKRRRE